MAPEVSGSKIENYETFMARFSDLSKRQRDALELAYQFPKAAHGEQLQTRLTGERYFEHPRFAALILLDECGLNKSEDLPIICGTLLHDVFEDTALFGNKTKEPYSVWIKNVHRRVKWTFRHFLGKQGSRTMADALVAVTEPGIDGVDILNEEQAIEVKHQKLIEGPDEGLIIKMADRLHNLRHFVPKIKEGQKTPQEKIDETEKILIPAFERALSGKYAKAAEYLIAELRKSIVMLRAQYFLSPAS